MAHETEEEKLELHSEEVQDILSRAPGWMITWGTTVIFVIIFVFILLSWLIKYPEIITGSVLLTTRNPPVKVVTKVGGKIQKLYTEEQAMTKSGAYLAEIESSVRIEDIKFLKHCVAQIDSFLQDPGKPVNFSERKVLGDVQTDYNNLIDVVSEYQRFLNSDYHEKMFAYLDKRINDQRVLMGITDSQLTLSHKKLLNAREKFNAEQKLLNAQVISKHDFLIHENNLINESREFEELKKLHVQSEISIKDYEIQRYQLAHDQRERNLDFQRSIQLSANNINSFISGWERNYVLKSPIDGTVTYLRRITEGQFFPPGEELFTVVPSEEEYVGIINLPLRGFGKVEIGQTVHLSLDSYPREEFGKLYGEIESVSAVPHENQYRIVVRLTNGMTSNYRKELPFKPEMTGTAEILTEDLRLLERIFFRMIGLFD